MLLKKALNVAAPTLVAVTLIGCDDDPVSPTSNPAGPVAHISYFDRNVQQMKHAARLGDRWVIEVVAEASSWAGKSSLALDSAGNPSFIYSSLGPEMSSEPRLSFATRSDRGWMIEALMIDGSVGPQSLKVDSQGNPHISVGSHYATKFNGTWAIESFNAQSASGGSSLILDAQAEPHIVHTSVSSSHTGLMYTSKIDGHWASETIARDAHSGTIAFDKQGTLQVGYVVPGERWLDGSIVLAARSAGTWLAESVDSGFWCELVTDEEGRSHIAYLEDSFQRGGTEGYVLVYASKADGEWIREPIDNGTPLSVSLAIDNQGNPHISYVNLSGDESQQGFTLKYATKSGDDWIIETVDAMGDMHHTSLAVAD